MPGTYTCSGSLAAQQTLSGAPLIVTRATPGFTITAAGDAFDLTGTGELTFIDNYASPVAGGSNGLEAVNNSWARFPSPPAAR